MKAFKRYNIRSIIVLLNAYFAEQANLAYNLIKDFEPSNSYEYVLKAVVYASVGQEEGSVSFLFK